ncbi:L-threonylcarbamoyladenylate synthase [Mangrovibacterium marinum]|uniref:Translation factor SUA5 n=1 Tax=Mangrovibacterium marinum TaxID=1639118 RepID=A0A2T5BZ35_9BACT|nr:L-threonylcarbamoyladenylate synthase [Mangrovibacterium marinum]PTN07524.1 translation factor SUA5 [Mangrovibacterium marinum]
MLVKIYNENPNEREINRVVDLLRNGGIIIYPTDTIYGIGCDITNAKAVERVARIKGVDVAKADLSFICSDLSHLSAYAKPIPNHVFKLMRRCLPGPYTFILEANNQVPKYFKGKKKTVGIRVPDNAIVQAIVRELGNPILSTSVKDEDEILEYTTDPELIDEKFEKLVDLVIDGGFGGNIPSTVIDCTSGVPEIVRQGKGKVEL